MDKRKSGENPERSRHCKVENTACSHCFFTGRRNCSMKPSQEACLFDITSILFLGIPKSLGR